MLSWHNPTPCYLHWQRGRSCSHMKSISSLLLSIEWMGSAVSDCNVPDHHLPAAEIRFAVDRRHGHNLTTTGYANVHFLMAHRECLEVGECCWLWTEDYRRIDNDECLIWRPCLIGVFQRNGMIGDYQYRYCLTVLNLAAKCPSNNEWQSMIMQPALLQRKTEPHDEVGDICYIHVGLVCTNLWRNEVEEMSRLTCLWNRENPVV